MSIDVEALAEALATAIGGWYGDSKTFHDNIVKRQAAEYARLVPAEDEPTSLAVAFDEANALRDAEDEGRLREALREAVDCLHRIEEGGPLRGDSVDIREWVEWAQTDAYATLTDPKVLRALAATPEPR